MSAVWQPRWDCSAARGAQPSRARREDRDAAVLVALLCVAWLSTGCSSAAKCRDDGECPAGSYCSAEQGVCFERLGFAATLGAGVSHTCAGTNAGGLRCWGANGLLGDGTAVDRPTAASVVDVSADGGELLGVQAVAAGGFHTCALLDGGAVRCWGLNDQGQVLGAPSGPNAPSAGKILSPAAVASLGNMVALGLGQYHSCGLTADGGIRCWGDNSQGQVGPWAISSDSSVAPSGSAVALASGAAHSCVVTREKRLFCWGGNSSGQANWRLASKSVGPTDLDLSDVESVAAGQSHTCAVTSAHDVLCWGANSQGQLGRPTPSSGARPATPSLTGVRAIAAGCDHTCALQLDGGVSCWGSNGLGELGNGVSSDAGTTRATPVLRLPAAEGLAAGCRHTCAFVRGDGGPAVYCWGDDGRGQLGDGKKQNSSVPVEASF